MYLIAKDIAESDGNVGEKEQRVLDLIAKRLNVDASKFEF